MPKLRLRFRVGAARFSGAGDTSLVGSPDRFCGLEISNRAFSIGVSGNRLDRKKTRQNRRNSRWGHRPRCCIARDLVKGSRRRTLASRPMNPCEVLGWYMDENGVNRDFDRQMIKLPHGSGTNKRAI